MSGLLGNFDAAPSNYFGDYALTHTQQRVYEIELEPLKFRQFIPINNEVPAGAEAWAYWMIEEVGEAKLLKSYADDIAPVDASRDRFVQAIVMIANKYMFSKQELAADALYRTTAGAAGAPIDVQKALAARKFIERKLNEIAAIGVTEIGTKGLTNHASIPIIGGLTGTWASATPAQIVADIAILWAAVRTNTLENHTPNTLLVPTTQWARLATTQLSTGSDLTIAGFIKANFPELKTIESWDRFDGAGVGPTDRVLIYDKNPQVLDFVISQEFEQEPPQTKGLVREVICTARTGGLQVRYPKAMAYGDGV